MNCKQGDLAVIVRSLAGHEGKIICCLRLAPMGGNNVFPGPRWEIDRHLAGSLGTQNMTIADCAMRPLRDSYGEDEILRLVGLPAGTPQAA